MKISLAVDCRRMGWTGVGVYIRNVLSRLCLCDELDITCLGNPEDIRLNDWSSRVRIIGLNAGLYSLREQPELLFKVPACDLLWAPHNLNLPLLYSGRLLVTVHDLDLLAFPEYTRSLPRKLYASLMYGALKRKADAVISVSEFTARELTSRLLMDRSRIHVVHNGLDSSWFDPCGGRPPQQTPYVLFVGNVKPHKNLSALLRAFKLVKDRIPHDLVIVGKKDGFMTGDRRATAEAESLGGRVTFTGALGDDSLRGYYAHADALLFPSLYEGFGFPPLEAMASGCPVLVSNAASLPEVCGDAALYCDPCSTQDIADKITALLGNRSLREELRLKGLKRAASFTWERSADETFVVIKKVAGR